LDGEENVNPDEHSSSVIQAGTSQRSRRWSVFEDLAMEKWKVVRKVLKWMQFADIDCLFLRSVGFNGS
jgi:hypothetical protein